MRRPEKKVDSTKRYLLQIRRGLPTVDCCQELRNRTEIVYRYRKNAHLRTENFVYVLMKITDSSYGCPKTMAALSISISIHIRRATCLVRFFQFQIATQKQEMVVVYMLAETSFI